MLRILAFLRRLVGFMEIAKDPETVPLAERFQAAQFLSRELEEHIRQSFLPKLSALRSASKVDDVEEVSDQEMFDRLTAVIQSDEFAARLFGRLFRYLESIARDTREVTGVDL
ncbi:MAG: hypothetical protein ACK526_14455 [Planctomyces sp.]